MKLVRNTTKNGRGKYMLVLTRKLDTWDAGSRVQAAADFLIETGVIDDPEPETEGEFFVLRMKDRHALPALLAYAESVRPSDPEFAGEIDKLAARSGENNPWCKEPD